MIFNKVLSDLLLVFPFFAITGLALYYAGLFPKTSWKAWTIKTIADLIPRLLITIPFAILVPLALLSIGSTPQVLVVIVPIWWFSMIEPIINSPIKPRREPVSIAVIIICRMITFITLFHFIQKHI